MNVRNRDSERGALLLEWVLVVPILYLMMVGTVELAQSITLQSRLLHLSRIAAYRVQSECAKHSNLSLCVEQQANVLWEEMQIANPGDGLRISYVRRGSPRAVAAMGTQYVGNPDLEDKSNSRFNLSNIKGDLAEILDSDADVIMTEVYSLSALRMSRLFTSAEEVSYAAAVF